MSNSSKILLIISIILAGIIVYLYIDNKELEYQAIKYENNFKVSQDSLKVINLENGELMFTKGSYILEIEELEKYIGVKDDYIKLLEGELESNIIYISNIEASLTNFKDSLVSNAPIIIDTVYRDSIIYINTSRFNFDTEWYNIYGKIEIYPDIVSSTLEGLYVNLPLTVGLTDNWEIFVTTPNPYINISSINGSLIDKTKYTGKQKTIQFGIQAGLYCIYNDGFRFGPGIGLGVNIKLF